MHVIIPISVFWSVGGLAPPIDDWKTALDETNKKMNKLAEDYEQTLIQKKVTRFNFHVLLMITNISSIKRIQASAQLRKKKFQRVKFKVIYQKTISKHSEKGYRVKFKVKHINTELHLSEYIK